MDGPVISRLQENLGDWRDVTYPLGRTNTFDLQSTNKALLRKAGVKSKTSPIAGCANHATRSCFIRTDGKERMPAVSLP